MSTNVKTNLGLSMSPLQIDEKIREILMDRVNNRVVLRTSKAST